ncbi:MAG: NADPH-dependent F420 reductase [Hyphomicrobiales bacterium]|nr:NADPH-dependent F420 reductase [Hyphomicrobiales bacterium]MCP4999314.1 NADPH-dependent F420 reductase [Hyphomicrobiales bacterium]
MTDKSNIAIIGGTGALGAGLALRWARAGHTVTIGSRDGERADKIATELSARAGTEISGLENAAAAAKGDIVAMTVPYASHAATLETIRPHLDGKILIDVTVPLMPPKVRTVQLPEGGSVAKAVQQTLGEGVRVVSAFQNVAAAHLAELDHAIDCDVLVCGNDPAAREAVVKLATDGGMKAWHAGRIDNSAIAEALTSALIFINGHYKIPGAGIRITGNPAPAEG